MCSSECASSRVRPGGIADIITYLKVQTKPHLRRSKRGTDLSYTDVIQAMQALRELDWIEEREDEGAGVGRSGKIYTVKNPSLGDRKAL